MSKEVFNPKYAKALEREPTLGLPLFNDGNGKPLPPKTVKYSSSRNDSFRSLRESGKLNALQLRVLHCIKTRGPIALFQIAEALHLQNHIVSGRLTELRTELGLIEIATSEENPKGKILNPSTNIHVNLYRVKS
jgi:hypothetical protein